MLANILRSKRKFVIPASGLITRYTMGNISGSTLIDEVGTSNGTINGAIQVAGPTGSALYFDGAISKFIETNNRYNFIHQTGIFSVHLWLNADSYNDGGGYTFAGSTLTNSEVGSFFIYEDRSAASADRQVRATIFNGRITGDTPTVNVGTNNTQPASGWNLISVEGNGTTVFVYVNNVLVSSSPIGTKSAAAATRTLQIGRANFSSPTLGWKGAIGETLIYNRALSTEERAAILSMGV